MMQSPPTEIIATPIIASLALDYLRLGLLRKEESDYHPFLPKAAKSQYWQRPKMIGYCGVRKTEEAEGQFRQYSVIYPCIGSGIGVSFAFRFYMDAG
jgi:hypothetical protein